MSASGVETGCFDSSARISFIGRLRSILHEARVLLRSRADGEERLGMALQLLEPDAVLVDLREDVAVGRARDAEADRAGRAVPRQTDDPDVVREVLAAELRSEAELLRPLEELLLQLRIAERAAGLVARRRQRVVVAGRGELHGLQARLRRRAADDDRDVVRRARRRAEALHLLDEERLEARRVQERLRLLEEMRSCSPSRRPWPRRGTCTPCPASRRCRSAPAGCCRC